MMARSPSFLYRRVSFLPKVAVEIFPFFNGWCSPLFQRKNPMCLKDLVWCYVFPSSRLSVFPFCSGSLSHRLQHDLFPFYGCHGLFLYGISNLCGDLFHRHQGSLFPFQNSHKISCTIKKKKSCNENQKTKLCNQKFVSPSHACIRELGYQFMQLGKIRFDLMQFFKKKEKKVNK